MPKGRGGGESLVRLSGSVNLEQNFPSASLGTLRQSLMGEGFKGEGDGLEEQKEGAHGAVLGV